MKKFGEIALLYGHGVVDHAMHQLSDVGWPTAVTVLKNALLLVSTTPQLTSCFLRRPNPSAATVQ